MKENYLNANYLTLYNPFKMMNGISKNKIIFHSKLKRVLKLGTDHLT
jgi:hypothetical protein